MALATRPGVLPARRGARRCAVRRARPWHTASRPDAGNAETASLRPRNRTSASRLGSSGSRCGLTCRATSQDPRFRASIVIDPQGPRYARPLGNQQRVPGWACAGRPMSSGFLRVDVARPTDWDAAIPSSLIALSNRSNTHLPRARELVSGALPAPRLGEQEANGNCAYPSGRSPYAHRTEVFRPPWMAACAPRSSFSRAALPGIDPACLRFRGLGTVLCIWDESSPSDGR